MKPALSFFGLGYVGLTLAACFASKHFRCLVCDVNKSKVETVNKGEVPFFEPALRELVASSVRNGFLEATLDPSQAVLSTDVTFIAVGTPSDESAGVDLRQVKNASYAIGENLSRKSDWHLIVVKSTVPPTTTEQLVKPIIERTSGKSCPRDFGLCVNPEFLREGSAVEDALKPDRIVIGEVGARSGHELESIYKKFYARMPPLLRTKPVNAELIKCANNAFLATKVSFINSIASLCQRIPDSDVEEIAKGIGLDKRIGPFFLKAGVGWGGSCFRKDLDALVRLAQSVNADLPLVETAARINETQPLVALDLACQLLGHLKGKRVSVLGLSFKPGTDDMREAPSIKIVNALLDAGAEVIVHDPRALSNARRIFGDAVHCEQRVGSSLEGADCCIIVTEWEEYKALKPDYFTRRMKNPVVVDGRRIYDHEDFRSIKFAAVGRALSPSQSR
jgi:UDPglucose 6-dehydrogenase